MSIRQNIQDSSDSIFSSGFKFSLEKNPEIQLIRVQTSWDLSSKAQVQTRAHISFYDQD